MPPTRLIDHPGLTMPAGAVAATIPLPDGTLIRTARWPARGDAAPKGTVVICTGRSEFIEKYFDVVGDLLARGFAVATFDWRGQGLSTRFLPNRRKGHIADFRLFEDDLDAVLEQVVRPFCPQPHFGLAHSMGGAVLIHHARRGSGAFERIVLSAPMVEVHNLPFPRNLRRLVRGLTRAGLGAAFLPQGQRVSVLERGFANNLLTSDPERFAAMLAFVRAEPGLALGPPTVGWLDAAFRAMLVFEDPAFCAAIDVPMLVVVPGSDRVVSVAAMERFARRLRTGSMVRIPHARHEILMERDDLRDRFWAAFDAFVPGAPGPSTPALRPAVVNLAGEEPRMR